MCEHEPDALLRELHGRLLGKLTLMLAAPTATSMQVALALRGVAALTPATLHFFGVPVRVHPFCPCFYKSGRAEEQGGGN